MFSFIYVSIATRPLTGGKLIELLEQARRNNERLEITGMLLCKNGNCMQVLEGEESAVRIILAKISKDKRHHTMITLLEGASPAREFPDWSMGFSNLDTPEAEGLPGYSDFMNTELSADSFASDPTRAWSFLRLFKRMYSG